MPTNEVDLRNVSDDELSRMLASVPQQELPAVFDEIMDRTAARDDTIQRYS